MQKTSLKVSFFARSEVAATAGSSRAVNNKADRPQYFFSVSSIMPSASSLVKKTVTLLNGVEMPLLALGTGHVVTADKPDRDAPEGFAGFAPERTYHQMQLALEAGVRSFDTALIYRTEKAVGHLLGNWWADGKLEKRSDVWITSKIYNCRQNERAFASTQCARHFDKTSEQITDELRGDFETSLQNLGVGYVDLMLLHWPSSPSEGNPTINRQHRLDAWKVLEHYYRLGFCRAIGVCNFSVAHLKQLQEDGATITPMVNQMEASVIIQQTDIRQYCQEQGIVPIAYSVLRGLGGDMPDTLRELAASKQKDPGQIAFRYLLQHGYAVLFLTCTQKRMISNANVFDFELSDDEMKALDALNDNSSTGWGLPRPDDCE